MELTNYNGIPHLLVPVVTDAKKAASALHWAVAEMERRYQSFADTRVRDIKSYNAQAVEKMPFIVIVIDEMSDLMMVAKADVEDAILRLAQKARACGIHLVLEMCIRDRPYMLLLLLSYAPVCEKVRALLSRILSMG